MSILIFLSIVLYLVPLSPSLHFLLTKLPSLPLHLNLSMLIETKLYSLHVIHSVLPNAQLIYQIITTIQLQTNHPTCMVPLIQLVYPISSFLSYHKLCKPHRAFTLVISTQTEPQTFSQVVESQVWRDAMDIKLQALESNGT